MSSDSPLRRVWPFGSGAEGTSSASRPRENEPNQSEISPTQSERPQTDALAAFPWLGQILQQIVDTQTELVRRNQSELLQLPPLDKVFTRKVKTFTIPKLADGKDIRDDVVYTKWVPQARASIDAAGALYILENDLPAGERERDWYETADAIVFSALLKSVIHINFLCEKVVSFQGEAESSRRSWVAIREHFIKQSVFSAVELDDELSRFSHNQGESMEGLLTRLQLLINKFNAYGVEIADKTIVLKLFKLLPRQWVKAIQHKFAANSMIDSWAWEDVKEALLAEDFERRHAGPSDDGRDLPLGFQPKSKVARQGGAAAVQPQPKAGELVPKGSNPKKNAFAAKKGAGPKGAPNSNKQNFVCFFCKKRGHSWEECWTKPPNWEPSPKDREEALKIKESQKPQPRFFGHKGAAKPAQDASQGHATNSNA
jgi:hypothetical protein